MFRRGTAREPERIFVVSSILHNYSVTVCSFTNWGEKSTPRPGASGTIISDMLSFQPPGNRSLYIDVSVFPCSMIRKFGIDVITCSDAAVHSGPFGLCGAMFT